MAEASVPDAKRATGEACAAKPESMRAAHGKERTNVFIVKVCPQCPTKFRLLWRGVDSAIHCPESRPPVKAKTLLNEAPAADFECLCPARTRGLWLMCVAWSAYYLHRLLVLNRDGGGSFRETIC